MAKHGANSFLKVTQSGFTLFFTLLLVLAFQQCESVPLQKNAQQRQQMITEDCSIDARVCSYKDSLTCQRDGKSYKHGTTYWIKHEPLRSSFCLREEVPTKRHKQLKCLEGLWQPTGRTKVLTSRVDSKNLSEICQSKKTANCPASTVYWGTGYEGSTNVKDCSANIPLGRQGEVHNLTLPLTERFKGEAVVECLFGQWVVTNGQCAGQCLKGESFFLKNESSDCFNKDCQFTLEKTLQEGQILNANSLPPYSCHAGSLVPL